MIPAVILKPDGRATSIWMAAEPNDTNTEHEMSDREFWLLQGLRTPFTKVDGQLSDEGAIEISVPVVREMNRTHRRLPGHAGLGHSRAEPRRTAISHGRCG